MAYVRQKANQLLIVHGERDPETRKVTQHVLFTLYSKAEALEAIGKTAAKRDWQFQRLLQSQYPDISFDWDKINKQIREKMGNLPDLWEYGNSRLRKGFRRGVVEFVRHLLLADPQMLTSSRELIQEHTHELEYARELIDFRLKVLDTKPSEFDSDTPFYWRYMLQGRYLSGDEEECIEEMWHKGETEKAHTLFHLMTECFDDYAEGHNYLGLMALEEEDLEEALDCFRQTMRLGEKLFPKRLAKKHYWRDIKTRPFMRGVFNSTTALIRMDRFAEALELAQILEDRCGNRGMAQHYRAKIYINLGRWQAALDCAVEGEGGGEGFLAAVAAGKLGQKEDSLVYCLQAALNRPRTARMLANQKVSHPEGTYECEEHNLAVALNKDLGCYVDDHRPGSGTVFEKILRYDRVLELLEEVETLVKNRHQGDATARRRIHARLEQMRTRNFARVEVMELRATEGWPME
jgi:tetratricopeptide (TPR) repeat protein